MSSGATARDAPGGIRGEGRAVLQLVASTWFPLFFGLGLVFSYLGAFHHPDVHDVKVVVAGAPATTGPVAGALRSHGDAFAVTTSDAPAAVLRAEVTHRRVAVVYLPAPAQVGVTTPEDGPEALVAEAADASVVARVEPTILALGAARGQPVKLDDLVPYDHEDYNGSGPFYLLIALSLGSYLPVTLLTLARPEVPLRRALAATLLLGLISSVVVAVAGALVYRVAGGHFWPVLGIGVWYCSAVALVGIALRSLIGVVAPAVVTLLFAILNFPSSGGTYAPALLPTFFGWCHDVLPGAAVVGIVRSVVYFHAEDIGHGLVVLGAWLAGGLVLTGLAVTVERRRGTADDGAGAAVERTPEPAHAG